MRIQATCKLLPCMKKTSLILSLVAVLVAGCATSQQPTVKGNGHPAVMCQSCGWMWVASAHQGGKPTAYPTMHKHRNHPCSTCANMAAQYLGTRKMQGVCGQCGESLRTCIVAVKPQKSS